MLNISRDPRRKYVLGELEAEAAPYPPSSGPDSASWIRVINLGSGAASNLIWKRSLAKSLTRMRIRTLKSPGPDSALSGASNTETAPVPPLPGTHLCQLGNSSKWHWFDHSPFWTQVFLQTLKWQELVPIQILPPVHKQVNDIWQLHSDDKQYIHSITS